MPITIPPASEGPTLPPHRIRWTRDQCRRMQDDGILSGRYELVDGEIVSKRGQNPPHAYVIRVLMALLVRVFGEDFVQIQLPIRIVGEDEEHNDPEPDCAVLALPAQEFADHHPLPTELRLVIEVSDSKLAFDLNTKSKVYGRAGIAEYWVIDVTSRRIVVLRNPSPAGYTALTAYAETERCAPLASLSNSVLVAGLLPPLNN